ncbi:hypothetical protein FRACA_840025 [Frankia canadensis]|uniref:Uncharacterized protein n=1 Tax=Frankia canadensis TaxID=1836972 RepID=A0A2I2L1Z8_9ACTN|nr:hypothetical protein FRACA_840025 [Frankia canadensis]SOU59177.1 hypothetical protein FRACA_840025 [Frankia canadensis]
MVGIPACSLPGSGAGGRHRTGHAAAQGRPGRRVGHAPVCGRATERVPKPEAGGLVLAAGVSWPGARWVPPEIYLYYVNKIFHVCHPPRPDVSHRTPADVGREFAVAGRRPSAWRPERWRPGEGLRFRAIVSWIRPVALRGSGQVRSNRTETIRAPGRRRAGPHAARTRRGTGERPTTMEVPQCVT